ncbi:MAG: ATP-binding protein [Candidatus Methanomethylophilaceae archaeon]
MTSSESYTSVIQDLSFESSSDDIETILGPGSFGKLPLRNRNGSFNNFALLLSDQCPWSFEILSGQYGVLHRCTGSILRQVDDVLRVMDSINPRLRVKGRTGFIRKFPKRALEEGVLNAAIHFDISRMMDITIELSSDRLVVISPGGMIEPEDWGPGATTCPRNRMLAELFREMGKVTLHFCGVRAIRDSYLRTGQIPLMRKTPEFFLVFCPSVAQDIRDHENLSRRISDVLALRPGATLTFVSERLLISPSVALRALMRMEEEGVIFEMGTNNSRRFYLYSVRKRLRIERSHRAHSIHIGLIISEKMIYHGKQDHNGRSGGGSRGYRRHRGSVRTHRG